jgi:hypothetical protein
MSFPDVCPIRPTPRNALYFRELLNETSAPVFHLPVHAYDQRAACSWRFVASRTATADSRGHSRISITTFRSRRSGNATQTACSNTPDDLSPAGRDETKDWVWLDYITYLILFLYILKQFYLYFITVIIFIVYSIVYIYCSIVFFSCNYINLAVLLQ